MFLFISCAVHVSPFSLEGKLLEVRASGFLFPALGKGESW